MENPKVGESITTAEAAAPTWLCAAIWILCLLICTMLIAATIMIVIAALLSPDTFLIFLAALPIPLAAGLMRAAAMTRERRPGAMRLALTCGIIVSTAGIVLFVWLVAAKWNVLSSFSGDRQLLTPLEIKNTVNQNIDLLFALMCGLALAWLAANALVRGGRNRWVYAAPGVLSIILVATFLTPSLIRATQRSPAQIAAARTLNTVPTAAEKPALQLPGADQLIFDKSIVDTEYMGRHIVTLTTDADNHVYAVDSERALLRIDAGTLADIHTDILATLPRMPHRIGVLSESRLVLADSTGLYLYDLEDGRQAKVAEIVAWDLAVSRAGMVYLTVAGLAKLPTVATDDSARLLQEELHDAPEKPGIDAPPPPPGQLLVYDSQRNETRVLLDNLGMATGVALSADEQYLLVADAVRRRVLRYWLKGPDAGTHDLFRASVPGQITDIERSGNSGWWAVLTDMRLTDVWQYEKNPYREQMAKSRYGALLMSDAGEDRMLFDTRDVRLQDVQAVSSVGAQLVIARTYDGAYRVTNLHDEDAVPGKTP